jgi:Ser/Thr protein kinase RdoA (MazF antagonist)
MRLTVARLRAMQDALAKLSAAQRGFPERHYREAEDWIILELERRNSLKKEPEMF